MMKPLYNRLAVFLLLPVILTACATGGAYWVPPPPSGPSPQALALLSETPIPTLLPEITETVPAVTDSPTDTSAAQYQVDLSPTATPTGTIPDDAPILYTVQAADTLPVVAVRFGVHPAEIAAADGSELPETAFLDPGKLLIIPRRLANTTSPEHLIPDSDVVFSPSAVDFDVHAYVEQAAGKLSTYHDWLRSTGSTSGADVVLRVATENSINPRLLLSLLEYQSGWVYGQPDSGLKERYPLGKIDSSKEGLYNQLVWAVNQISTGYYSYREGRLTEIRFPDGVTARLAPDLNAGTAAIQYFFAQIYQGQEWLDALDPETGFPAVHVRVFGNPWERALTVEPLFPPGITQPDLILPFTRNWQWSFTGGPHGAWEHEGAFAALDFAPGSTQSGCVKSNAWVTAAASGLVVRSGNGVVVIDLDGDGREQTGWVLLYLHIAAQDRIAAGTFVDAGQPIGHPSCEGGFSTGTHVHIARKYNGEWIPAAGPIPFNLGGWVAHPGDGAYKGTLTRGDKTVTACTCSSAATLIVRTDDDP